MYIQYNSKTWTIIITSKKKKRSKTMFACLELLKVSESVARRTGDLSAQVGRRVVCVAPCRLSKPVQAKSARLVPKDCPSVKREKKLFWRLGDNLRKSGGLCFFLWHLGLDRISYGRHANCVQVLGSQPTHSQAAEMWKSVARRTGDLSA